MSNNFPVEGWHTVLSPERMEMEIVEGLAACVENNVMHAKRSRVEAAHL